MDATPSGMDRMSNVMTQLLGDQPQTKESTRKRRRRQVEEERTADSSSDEDDKKIKGSDIVDECHISPDLSSWEYEKRLKKLATRGVVQLFNAVNKQQKDLDKKLKSVGSSERKRDKVLQSLDKGTFLDMLKGKQTEDATSPNSKHKVSSTHDDQPSWSILRDNYKLDDAMKNWGSN